MSQLDNLPLLVQLQKTIDTASELQMALMHPHKQPDRAYNDIITDVTNNCYITSRMLDEKPPTL